MEKYIVNKDFKGDWFSAGDAAQNIMAPKPKFFKKGDIIEASEKQDFGLNTHLVSSDGFIILKDKVQLLKDNKNILTNKNIAISLVIIIVIILIFK